MGTDILDLDYDADIAYVRSVVGEKPILCGNIEPVLIQNTAPEEVERLWRELIALHGHERFILSAGCEITWHLRRKPNGDVKSQSLNTV